MNLTNQIILSKILEYLKATNYNHKKCGKTLMLKCPFCLKEPMSCNKIPNTSLLNCLNPDCVSEPFNLIDLIKVVEEDKKNYSDDDILDYLKKLLNLDLTTQKDIDKATETLDFLESQNYALIPLLSRDKEPLDNGWQLSEHRKKSDWMQWLSTGLNLGILTGEVNNLVGIDLDLITNEEAIELFTTKDKKRIEELNKKRRTIPEELKVLFNTPTLVQMSYKGMHFFYLYEKELRKTWVEYKNVHIDIESNKGQIVVFPSKETALKEDVLDENKKPIKLPSGKKKQKVIGYVTREWYKLISPAKMPTKLKEFLLEQINKGKKVEINEEGNQEVTGSKPMPLVEEGGVGRSNVLIKVTGLYRKQFKIEDTKKIVRTFNKNFINPPISNEILEKTVFTSLDKYVDSDYQLLKKQILEYIQDVESTSKTDIEMVVSGNFTKGETKKKLNIALLELIREEKITKKGRNYEIIQDEGWADDFSNIGIPIDFKMPYFEDIARFKWNGVILIGANTGKGKTFFSMNIINRLIKQGLKPDYLFTELEGGFNEAAYKLGISHHSFDFKRVYDPRDIILHKEEHKVVILDWLSPPNSEFNKLDSLFWELLKKISKVNGFLIVFMQLKKIYLKDGNIKYDWFAPNLAEHLPSLACQLLHEDDKGIYSKLKITKIRFPKQGAYTGMSLPSIFDKKTAELKLVGEE